MRNWTLVALTALAFGGVTYFAGTTSLADDQTNAPAKADLNTSAAPANLPDGFTAKKLNEDKDIRGELANATGDAVTKDHFDNLIGNLNDQDRNRMKDEKNRDVTALNTKIDEFNKAWKDKYGHSFSDHKDKKAFDDVAIITGEVSNPDVAINNWPVDVLTGRVATTGKEARTASEQENKKAFGGDVNLDKGRNVALVTLPAEQNLPALNLSMLHELPDQWRFDIPNNITAQQIYDNWLSQISDLVDHKDQWPANEQDAYRLVSHRAVMALYNVPVSGTAEGARSTQ